MKKILEFVIVSLLISSIVIILIGTYKGGIILFGDTNLSYHFAPKIFSFKDNFIWNEHFQQGTFDYNLFQGFFLRKIVYFLSLVVNNLYLFSYLWYFLTYYLYSITIYFFIKELNKTLHVQNYKSLLLSFVLALLAILNGIFIIYAGQIIFILTLVLLNLFLICFVINLRNIERENKNIYPLLIFMGFLLSEISFYIQLDILLITTLFLLGLFNFRYITQHFRAFFVQLIMLGITALLFSSIWIIPLIGVLTTYKMTYLDLGKYDTALAFKQAQSVSSNVFLHELLRLKSYHVFNIIPYVGYFFGIIPFLLIIVGLIKNKKNFLLYSFSLILIISIFLSYGVHPNTAIIQKILWKYLPVYSTFRTVMKFSFIYLYTVLIMLVLIAKTIIKQKKYIWYILLLFVAALSSIFYFSQIEFKRTMKQYKIPDYYYKVSKSSIISSKIVGNNLLLPQVNWLSQYDWAPPIIDSMNILPFFLDNGTMNNSAQYTPDSQYIFNDYANTLFRNSSLIDLKSLLSHRNIKDIIYQDDLRFSPDPEENILNKPSLSSLKNLISDKNICKKNEKFGKLTICGISNEIFKPIISVQNKKTTIKYQSHIDLLVESAVVLTDITSLGVTDKNDFIFMEGKKNLTSTSDRDIYLSMRPYVLQNCFSNGKPCNLYFAENLQKGTYQVYYKHYTVASDRKPLIGTSSIELYDNVEGDYISKSIAEYAKNSFISLPEKFARLNYFTFEIPLKDVLLNTYELNNNIVIRTDNSDYYTNGRFYFVKQTESAVNSISSLPIVEYTKENPTKYHVDIKNITSDFYLNLANEYHQGWKIQINDKKSYNVQSHYKAEQYSNTWHIVQSDKRKQNIDSLDIDIEFEPQKRLVLGLAITYFTLFCSSLYFGYSFMKYIFKKKYDK